MTNWIEIVLLLAICVLLGNQLESIRKLQEKLNEKPEPTPTPGVTMGEYHPPKEHTESSVIVEPKTPQLIAWEQEQQLDRENKLHHAKPGP